LGAAVLDLEAAGLDVDLDRGLEFALAVDALVERGLDAALLERLAFDDLALSASMGGFFC
jgi:hypothetical protein